MRVFVLVLVAATVIGGFVGGELSDRTFSLLGAVVGGLGTGAVLLGLGAYFTAQEERRKREALPPEIRQVFDRMFGSQENAQALVTAADKWRPRAFHQNQSKADYEEWFANAPGWSRVDPRLTSLLIDRLDGNPMFEVFVHASQDCNLVPKYEPLRALFDRGVGNVAALPRVAELLCAAGSAQGARCAEILQSRRGNQKELSELYANAINAFEASMHIEPNYLPAYVQLALLRSILYKKDEAANFCRLGLEAVVRLRSTPFHRSELATVKNAHRDLDEVENQLKSILASLGIDECTNASCDDENAEEKGDIDRRAQRYHEQIDAQIESTHKFLRDTFGKEWKHNHTRRHSLKTLSVFAVHIATLIAVKREFPGLHWGTLNGFTRTLSFRTPHTMPNVKPPDGAFVSYCSVEESFMLKQTKVFEYLGVNPLIRHLLLQLGGKTGDYNVLFDHLERVALQASRTYLPYLAEDWKGVAAVRAILPRSERRGLSRTGSSQQTSHSSGRHTRG